MPDKGHHCPFLNRADERCAEKFSIEHLDYAYRFCFDRYKVCAVYLELLVERRVRRVNGMATRVPNAPSPFVQLTISHGHAQQNSRAA